MILHIAVFSWKDDVTEADVTALTEALLGMAAGIPQLKSYTAGTNLRLRPGGDYAVAAVVEDAAALDAYLDSEAHQQVYADYLGRMIATRMAAQLPISSGAFIA